MGWVKISKKIKSSFWKTCFKLCVSPSLEFIKRNPETCLDLSVWDNSLLKHNNSVFLPRLFPTIKNKLTFVSDLVDPNTGQLFNLENFTLSKGEVNHEHFHRLATAVQSLLVSKNFNLRNISITRPSRPFWHHFFTLTPKGCRGWTRLLRLFKADNIRIREQRWDQKLNKNLGPIFWDRTYRNLTNIRYNNRLKYFQFQINRDCLKTNNVISHFIENQSDLCTFCNLYREDTLHLLWSCQIVQDFYSSLIPFFNALQIPWPPDSREKFLFGNYKESFLSINEYLYLQLKHYIWTSRCTKSDLSILFFKNKLTLNITLDLYLLGGGGERGGGRDIERRETMFAFIGELANKIGIG